MLNSKVIEFTVGIFILLGVLALLMLAFRVSGLTTSGHDNSYEVTANFNNIGGLKVRAPVAIAGVKIGQVSAIDLDQQSFEAKVTLRIDGKENQLPTDSSASILTQGLLGANYISIAPGYEETYLKNNDTIEETHSALILENLIGQLIFSFTKNDDEKPSTSSSAAPATTTAPAQS